MTFDVIAALDNMQARFYDKFGDIHIPELTQHEKHLTWMSSYYSDKRGLTEGVPYCSQEYNNFTFSIGYRIGCKEAEHSYNTGYEAGVADCKYALESMESE